MFKNKVRNFIFSGMCLGLLLSCDMADKSVHVYKVKKHSHSTMEQPVPPSPSTAEKSSNTIWSAPSHWVSKPASGMHLAAFAIPHEKGESQVTLMTLQGTGGGILMNVNRWLNQLNLPPVTESEIEKMGTEFTGKAGSFTVFELINEKKPEKAFMVAVFGLPSQTLFIKLVTSKNQIETHKPSFMAFCESIQLDD